MKLYKPFFGRGVGRIVFMVGGERAASGKVGIQSRPSVPDRS